MKSYLNAANPSQVIQFQRRKWDISKSAETGASELKMSEEWEHFYGLFSSDSLTIIKGKGDVAPDRNTVDGEWFYLGSRYGLHADRRANTCTLWFFDEPMGGFQGSLDFDRIPGSIKAAITQVHEVMNLGLFGIFRPSLEWDGDAFQGSGVNIQNEPVAVRGQCRIDEAIGTMVLDFSLKTRASENDYAIAYTYDSEKSQDDLPTGYKLLSRARSEEHVLNLVDRMVAGREEKGSSGVLQDPFLHLDLNGFLIVSHTNNMVQFIHPDGRIEEMSEEKEQKRRIETETVIITTRTLLVAYAGCMLLFWVTRKNKDKQNNQN